MTTVAPTTEWRTRIERVLDGDGVTTVYQPIIDLQRAQVVGYEALSRFDAGDGVQAGPDVWFQTAAALGLGPQLDARCVSAALDARVDLPRNCFLAVNVDPESLLSPEVLAVLGRSAPLGGLVIEITEHRPWDWASLSPVVTRLRADGARFAVDDAGAGHSGLQQILHLRPDILKLDRSLVNGIDDDEAKVALDGDAGPARQPARCLAPGRRGGDGG